MHFTAGCTWTLVPLMLNVQTVWAAGVGARSTADKCDAVFSLKRSLTWAAVLQCRTLQLSKSSTPLFYHYYQSLPCSMAANWFVQQSISENHHYYKKGNSYRMELVQLELTLEPDRELLQRQNPKDVMLIMVDYISCIDFLLILLCPWRILLVYKASYIDWYQYGD